MKATSQRKPKVSIDQDTSEMSETAVRAYYKQNDLYYSALFHARHAGNAAMQDLAERILVQGQTKALKQEYLALYEAQQRQHRSWVMPGDSIDTRTQAEWYMDIQRKQKAA